MTKKSRIDNCELVGLIQGYLGILVLAISGIIRLSHGLVPFP